MITIRIPIHSFIDVITNSSTEVFINAHDKSVEMAKSILATILKASGSKKNVDDVFDVSTELVSGLQNNLVIKVKNDDKNLADEILKMFDIEAEYNE